MSCGCNDFKHDFKRDCDDFRHDCNCFKCRKHKKPKRKKVCCKCFVVCHCEKEDDRKDNSHEWLANFFKHFPDHDC
jgi:hypothetical protein